MAANTRYPSSSFIIRGKCSRSRIVGAERLLLQVLLEIIPSGSLVVGRTRVTIQQVADAVSTHIAAATATDAARARLVDLMKEEAEARRTSRGFVIALRQYAQVLFGDDSLECMNLGFAPKKGSKRTVATKLAAVAKSAATRKQRNTLGKRQKAKLKGNAAR